MAPQITALASGPNTCHALNALHSVSAQPAPVFPRVPVQGNQRPIRWHSRLNWWLLIVTLLVLVGGGWVSWRLGVAAQLPGVLTALHANLMQKPLLARLRADDEVLIQLTRNPILVATAGAVMAATPAPLVTLQTRSGQFVDELRGKALTAQLRAVSEPTVPDRAVPGKTEDLLSCNITIIIV